MASRWAPQPGPQLNAIMAASVPELLFGGHVAEEKVPIFSVTSALEQSREPRGAA